VDVVSSSVVGVAPEKLPIIRAAVAAGYGETQLDRISAFGESIANVAIQHFRLPPQEHLEWRLPEWARTVLKDALTTKPVINNRTCIQCGICQNHCPQQAIEIRGKKLEIRYRDCIRCFCCQEFCPQGAITVGRGWALNMVK
jgi:Pyruvate/2-oxoacid:ferredoxin oxidoreductase delta subunit